MTVEIQVLMGKSQGTINPKKEVDHLLVCETTSKTSLMLKCDVSLKAIKNSVPRSNV